MPFPLFFELGGESRRDVADRFLTTIRRLDPHLQSASVQGWNALYRVGAPTGIVLASLGEQVTAAESLLREPEKWSERLAAAADRFPEARPAVEFFSFEYMPLKATERMSLANMYLAKIAQFTLDPGMRAMFAGSPPGLNLAQVVAERQTVLLDFRAELNPERRRFKTRWVFEYLMAFIKHRGAGRHRPLGLIVDELTELTHQASLEHDLFAADLEELINVYARNYSVWLTLAHQEMYQLSKKTQKALLTLGTQMIGLTADMDAAAATVRQYVALDPWLVKRWENVWGHNGGDYVIEERPVNMSLEEQVYLAARRLLALRPFQFVVRRRADPTLYTVRVRQANAAWASDRAEELANIRVSLGGRDACPASLSLANTSRVEPIADLPVVILENGDPTHEHHLPVELTFGEKATAAEASTRSN